MQRWLGVVCCAVVFLFISVKAFAETEDPEATGEFVVNAVLSRFNETGFETNENVLGVGRVEIR